MHARDRAFRSGGTALLAAFVIAALAASLAGCASGRAAVASSVAGKVGSRLRSLPTVSDTVRIPKAPLPPVPRTQVQTLAAAAEHEAIALIAPHVDGLSIADARNVVRGACTAYDLIALGAARSWDDAVGKALTSFGGRGTLRFRVTDLTKDMAEARSATDWTVKAGAFLLCETV
ncbi:MAG: hypothetical protein ACRDRA_02585 [Pseudonocardiaceae bacterium]